MYRTSMGGMATVALTGMRSSVHDVSKNVNGRLPSGFVPELLLRYLQQIVLHCILHLMHLRRSLRHFWRTTTQEFLSVSSPDCQHVLYLRHLCRWRSNFKRLRWIWIRDYMALFDLLAPNIPHPLLRYKWLLIIPSTQYLSLRGAYLTMTSVTSMLFNLFHDYLGQSQCPRLRTWLHAIRCNPQKNLQEGIPYLWLHNFSPLLFKPKPDLQSLPR